MIRTQRELRASRRALRRLEHAVEGSRREFAQDPDGFAFLKEQLDDLMRPIRRDLREYERRTTISSSRRSARPAISIPSLRAARSRA